jgi:hypothetical protein
MEMHCHARRAGSAAPRAVKSRNAETARNPVNGAVGNDAGISPDCAARGSVRRSRYPSPRKWVASRRNQKSTPAMTETTSHNAHLLKTNLSRNESSALSRR